MHDIRAIRDDPGAFDRGLARRGLEPVAGELLGLDDMRRERVRRVETLTAERNSLSRDAGRAKSEGDDGRFQNLQQQVLKIKAAIEDIEHSMGIADAIGDSVEEVLKKALLEIPNLPDADVPDGNDESGNVELRRWGTPATLDFAPREHHEIAGVAPGMDFETAAKMSGSRFVMLRGAVARIHRALAQFMLDTHVEENGLVEHSTPVLVRDAAMTGTDKLPKFGGDLFFGGSFGGRDRQVEEVLGEHFTKADRALIAGGGDPARVLADVFARAPTSEPYWLIPTSEVTLTYSVAGDVLEEADLPRRMTAHTLCFRSEAGSAGRDTAGMLRQHQFEKVEMVSITHPERSRAELDRMTRCAEGILERLGLPYRTVVLCTGDMGFGARRTHDIEVWLPGQDAYREISSCSTTGDFQARRMNARFRPAGGGKPEFVHTLNGSGLAVGRCLIAVLENGQRADGSVVLPEALGPWLGGRLTLTAEGVLV